MKPSTVFSFKGFTNISLIALFGLFLSSCATVNTVRESPLRWGYGFQVDPGWQVGNNTRNSVHALYAFSHIDFKGGGGHNNIHQAGVQFRHALDNKTNTFWYGGEAAYFSITNKFDNSSITSSAPGYTIGALAGYKWGLGKLPVSFYISPSYLRIGKFKNNGVITNTGRSGFYSRAGLSFHLTSLFHAKGR